MDPIFITGAGVVSAIGVGKKETLSSLISGQTGIGKMRYLKSLHIDIPVGEVKLTNEEMAHLLGVDNNPQFTRTALIGRLALREALEEASLDGDNLDDVHFISATTVGGMDRREMYHSQEKGCDSFVAEIATHNCAASSEMIAEQFATMFKGFDVSDETKDK